MRNDACSIFREWLVLGSLIVGGTTFAAGLPPELPPRQIGSIERVAPVEAPNTGAGDGRAVLVPATLEYEWIFHVPVVEMKPYRIVVTLPEASTRSRRWEYEVPGLRSKRIKLWDTPEISCKYPDVILPNECKTVWHGVYVDVPVLVSERGHVDIDVPRVRMTEQSFRVDVARWTWTEKRFRFSLPALAPAEAVEEVRISLNRQRAAVVTASDEAVAALDREIAAIQASGGDPSKLESDDGSPLDLPAQRQSLLAERAGELDRMSAIDAELSSLPARR
jgi:hypothetical protein